MVLLEWPGLCLLLERVPLYLPLACASHITARRVWQGLIQQAVCSCTLESCMLLVHSTHA
jgi:hypothetical protein